MLNEGVNMLAAIFAVAVLDGVLMVAYINTCAVNGVIVVDVEDFGNAWCNGNGKAPSISNTLE